MNRARRSRRAAFLLPGRALLLLAASVACAGIAAASTARAQEPAAEAADAELLPHPGALPGRHALLLFVSYRGQLAVPVHPTLVRREVSRRLADALTAGNRSVVTYPDVEPLMRSRRVRSESDLGLPFLGELADAFRLDHVTVVRLVTYDDRVLLLGRTLSPRTGRLQWAGVAEAAGGADLWTEPDGALARLETLLDGVAVELTAEAAPVLPEGAPALIALPLRPVGLGVGEKDLAWQCLLDALLRTETHAVPDPSLVVNAMQQGGFDPVQLDPRARAYLADAFSASGLLVPRMTAFPREGQVAAPAALVDSDAPRASALQNRVPMLFTLSLVDGATGAVIAGGSRYVTPEEPTGLFGRKTRRQLIRPYRESANELVRMLLTPEGTS